MAIPNLFQKSDANLGAMAYKMGEAQTPADMSRVFERMANSYDRTIQSTASMWGTVVKLAAPFIAEAAGNFMEKSNYRTIVGQEKYENEDNINGFLNGMDVEVENPDWVEGGDQPKTTINHIKGINEISDALKDTWLQGNPFRQENKTKRFELQKEKQQLYADIDLLEAGFTNITQIMNSGAYSKDALQGNTGDARFLAAASAMNNPGGKAKNGDYVKPSRDKDGNLILNLFGRDGSPILTDINNAESAQMSYKASEISNLITPDFPRLRLNGTKLFDNLIKTVGGGGNAEIAGKKFQNNLNELVRNPQALQYALHEKRFSHFQTSFVEDLMGNEGKGSNLSATLFQAISDTHGVDANGNVNLPTDENGNPIDIDLGANGVFDVGDFANEGVGLENYTKIASSIHNRNNPYYSEEATRDVFLHWAKQKAMGQAMVARGQNIPKLNFGSQDFRATQNKSSAAAQNILQAAQMGDFDNLVLPKKTAGGNTGVIKWNPQKKAYQVERDGEATLRFDPSNRSIEMLMRENGVSGVHINQMKKLGYFNQPLWRPKSIPERMPYGGRGAQSTSLKSEEEMSVDDFLQNLEF